MLVILDAWIELADFVTDLTVDFHQAKYSLAIGKDPLNDALILPIARISSMGIEGDGGTGGSAAAAPPDLEQLFRAQGIMLAAKEVAISYGERGVVTCDADVHMDWTVAPVDWWTWFASWNALEASPDGSLIDGERAYP